MWFRGGDLNSVKSIKLSVSLVQRALYFLEILHNDEFTLDLLFITIIFSVSESFIFRCNTF